MPTTQNVILTLWWCNFLLGDVTIAMPDWPLCAGQPTINQYLLRIAFIPKALLSIVPTVLVQYMHQVQRLHLQVRSELHAF